MTRAAHGGRAGGGEITDDGVAPERARRPELPGARPE